MPGPKKNTDRTEYEARYDKELRKTLQAQGDGDLYNEIELIRYMNLLTLKRMNAEGKKISYRDHLATLRAVTLAAGEIAYLASVQNRLFNPPREMEIKYKNEMDASLSRLLEIAEKLMDPERVNGAYFEGLREVDYSTGKRKRS